MNAINVALVSTVIIVVLAQNWIGLLKEWVQGKVAETQTGQTKT